MKDQASFLKNIRMALGRPSEKERSPRLFPQLFAKPDTQQLIQRVRSRTSSEREQLLETFVSNCRELNITATIATSFDQACKNIVEIAREKETEFTHTKHIIQHDHPDIHKLGLWRKFSRESVTVHTTYSKDPDIREKTIASFIGITAPSLGVAESATVLQPTSEGCPRSTSLLPSIHIALLCQENIVANLQEAYGTMERSGFADNFVFISGPSKTADIEARLVHGAHGPKEMHIVIMKT